MKINNWKFAIILFLTAGLYIDVKIGDVCNGPYRQKTLNVQTVVPFRPERETLYLGIGNKHYELIGDVWYNYDWDTRERLDRGGVHWSGCAAWNECEWCRAFSEHHHFIDLMFWK